MTHIVNLYGGPGTGKSTTAALLFAELKMAGVNAELVQEVAKQWAWQGRPITWENQVELFREQAWRMEILLGKVDVLVTDSPLLLGEFFTEWFSKGTPAENEVLAWLRAERAGFDTAHVCDGGKFTHVWLRREKPYNPTGRFQTEVEACRMDAAQRDLMMRTYHTHRSIRTCREHVLELARDLTDA
jgi:hypothetical protein